MGVLFNANIFIFLFIFQIIEFIYMSDVEDQSLIDKEKVDLYDGVLIIVMTIIQLKMITLMRIIRNYKKIRKLH